METIIEKYEAPIFGNLRFLRPTPGQSQYRIKIRFWSWASGNLPKSSTLPSKTVWWKKKAESYCTMQWHKIVAIFRSFVVESMCSMLFVLIGCGSTITWPQEETGPSVLSVSLCFGFACAFLLNISTTFSGGFFNPALTAALAAYKTLSAMRALCYVLAHLIGGKPLAL